jgi:CHAT domain-containing protein
MPLLLKRSSARESSAEGSVRAPGRHFTKEPLGLRGWLRSVAGALLLMPIAVQAEPASGCSQDDSVLAPRAVAPALELESTLPAGASYRLEAAHRLNDVGNAELERGDLAAAEAYYRSALGIRERLAPKSLPVAESLNALANVALERGELAQAKGYLEHSLRIGRALAPRSREVALSLVGLANFSRRRGELAREEGYLQQALQFEDALTPADHADIFDGLGNACGQQACAQKPQDYFSRALSIRQQEQPESLAMAGTLGSLGRALDNQGDLDEAERDFAMSLALRRRLAPGSLAVAASLTDLGVAARARGNLAEAELCLRKSLEIKRRLAPRGLPVADSLHNLAIVLWMRDDEEGARDYLGQALRLRRKLAPGSPIVAQSLVWQGLLAVRRHDLAEAQTDFTQALELLEGSLSPDSLAVAGVLANLGDVARMRGDLASAQQYQAKVLAIRDKVAPEAPAQASTLQALAGLARQRGELAEAEGLYRRALAIQERRVPDSSGHVSALFGLASLLRQEHDREQAERTYARAVDVLERQTASLGGTPEERSVFRARYENDYKSYVDLLVVLGQAEQGLSVLERARAWALLEMLARAQVSFHGGRDAVLDRVKRSLEDEIGARSSYRIRLLDGGYTQGQLSDVDRRLAELEDRYREIEDQIQLQSPAYAALTHPQTLSGAQVQALLDDDTLLLEYSLGPYSSYVWALTRTTLAVYPLPKRSVIEQAAERVRELMTARGRRVKETDARRRKRLLFADAQYSEAANELSHLVLGPVARLLTNRRIVVVSDGALQYIPFAALPEPPERTPGAPTVGVATPLVMQHEVTNLPSASVLAELRGQALRRTPAPNAVVVLADPVFDSRDERIAHAVKSQSVAGPVDGSPTPGIFLDRLSWTRLEAEQIMKVTPPGAGLQALDFDASRATALSTQLAKFRIVHFATHAVSDSERPERSGLVLSLFDRAGQPQNGFLGLEQIYGMNLPADLVVLSACETALGRQVDGEGLVGLVRGFMYAGATRVIASLWSVDDEVTASLMSRFYRSLEQDGLSPAAALRAAQLEVRKEKKWSDPYYWAGFQIEGEWR